MKKIELQNLKYSYGENQILKDINYEFNSGELVGILGANGCGKSTLLKIMMGFLKKENGQIYLDEKKQEEFSILDFSKKVSFITQKSNQNINFSVLELLKLGRVPHIKNNFKGLEEEDHQIVKEVIEELMLQEFLYRDVNSLSGGEFQKILLGRAFVQKGEVIFLDEPTSALDMNHSLELLSLLLKKIKEEQLIGVIVIHDINLASLFCDKIVFIKDGKIKYSGVPKEVIKEEILKDVYGFNPEVLETKDGIFVLPKKEKI
ncbi:ABC transporter ATP-binding protein [Cetobacterium sp.]|uniref:ABC transporter ATP-binding protein n=1 Tax=Cetobacterium sp. TaxID=2071632 RepID=UPI002FC94F47